MHPKERLRQNSDYSVSGAILRYFKYTVRGYIELKIQPKGGMMIGPANLDRRFRLFGMLFEKWTNHLQERTFYSMRRLGQVLASPQPSVHVDGLVLQVVIPNEVRGSHGVL